MYFISFVFHSDSSDRTGHEKTNPVLSQKGKRDKTRKDSLVTRQHKTSLDNKKQVKTTYNKSRQHKTSQDNNRPDNQRQVSTRKDKRDNKH